MAATGLDIPLDDAAQVAAWCHSGHCGDTSGHPQSLVIGPTHPAARCIGTIVVMDGRPCIAIVGSLTGR